MEFFSKPSNDFNAVRDGRNRLPFYIDIPLDSARSVTNGTSLVINIAGNSFYSDADTTTCGTARIHFQDTSFDIVSAPFFVSPGFIANVPFTQIAVENDAQPGKRLRIFYGVDVDFQAGVNSSISINGTVSVSNFPDPVYSPSVFWSSNTAQAANTAEVIISPATNINGLLVLDACFITACGGGPIMASIISKATAPISPFDGNVIVPTKGFTIGANYTQGELTHAVRIPAGQGLYFIANVGEASTYLFKHAKVIVL